MRFLLFFGKYLVLRGEENEDNEGQYLEKGKEGYLERGKYFVL